MFLGLDLSLDRTGIAVIDLEYRLVNTAIITVPQKGVERLFHLENILTDFMNSFSKLKLCCIEGYAYQERGKVFEIGEWTGIAKLNLFKSGIPFIIAAPSQLKKYVTGKGGPGIKKNLIILKVFQNFGEEFDDDNKCDAYVLARIARDYFLLYGQQNPSISIKKYQQDVLGVINKSQSTNSHSLI